MSRATLTPNINPNQLVTEVDAALLLGLARQTLRDWRCTERVRIPFVKVGRSVRYRYGDLLGFIDRHRQGGEAA